MANILGAATPKTPFKYLGKGISKSLANVAPKFTKRHKFYTPIIEGTAIGGIDAGARSMVDNSLTSQNITDALQGAATGAALGSLKGLVNLYSPKELTKDVGKGLINAVQKTSGRKILNRGISYSDDIAEDVVKKAPLVLSEINKNTIDKLSKVKGNSIDFTKANEAISKQYEKFFSSGKGKEQVISLAKDVTLNDSKLLSANGEPIRNAIESLKPQYKDLYKNLNIWQGNRLKFALKSGMEKTKKINDDYDPNGTLTMINKVKININDQINKAFKNGENDNVRMLTQIKKRLDELLKESGLKNLDKKFSNLKRAEEFYNIGAEYKPNNLLYSKIDFEKGGVSKLNKKAFLQGFIDKSILNPDNKNISKSIITNQDALKSVLPPKEFNNLINIASKNNVYYNRVNNLGYKAESRLGVPEPVKIFGREDFESKGALHGKLFDEINRFFRKGTYTKSADILLRNTKLKDSPFYNLIDKLRLQDIRPRNEKSES
jgi:hypothetical protein